MNGEHQRLQQMLLEQGHRIDALHESARKINARLSRVPDMVADEIESGLQQGQRSRLVNALSQATADSLETAVHGRPQAIVQAVYPLIGPAIRRSLVDALRQMTYDLDNTLNDTFNPRAVMWRWEAWRSRTPYAQVVLRHTTRYQVEHLFLIQPESGLLLGHLTAQGLPALDADAVVGMFTAINQFVCDSVCVEGLDSGIGSATVGAYQLAVSEGPNARLVAFVRGVPGGDFTTRLNQLNEELHARHGNNLVNAVVAGFNASDGLLEQPQLDELNARHAAQQDEAQPRRRSFPWFAIAVLLVLGAAYTWLAYDWSANVEDINTYLHSTPGLAISKLDDSRRGQLFIEGLIDPLAADPRPWLAQHHPGVEVEWSLHPFVSLEPALVQRRVAQMLHLPEASVHPPDAQGVVRLVGSVPFADWHRVRTTQWSTPGVNRIDTSSLEYPDQARIDNAIHAIQKLHVSFMSGRVTPGPGWQQSLASMTQQLQALEPMGAALGMALDIQAVGLTDEPGTLDQNRDLRQRRAAWLASRLAVNLHPPSTIAVEPRAAFALLPSQRMRSAAVLLTPSPAPVPTTVNP